MEYTRLNALLRRGEVFIDGNEYVSTVVMESIEGRAMLIVQIILGLVGDEPEIEKYLETRPEPKNWIN